MNNMRQSVKGIRIVAAIIDSILLGIVSGIAGFVVSFSDTSTDPQVATTIFKQVGFYTFLFSVVMMFLYHTVLPALTGGKTLGKMIVGIKVISVNYEPAKFSQLFLRNIFFFDSLILGGLNLILVSSFDLNNVNLGAVLGSVAVGFVSFVIQLVIFIMILSTEEERGFHDLIARTIVVDKNFDIDRINQANILEQREMTWANFEDFQYDDNQTTPSSSSSNDDDIQLLK